jgi:cytochrome c biogenesis factor
MKIVPLINLLWTGLVLLMVGVAMRIFALPSKDAVSSGQTYLR